MTVLCLSLSNNYASGEFAIAHSEVNCDHRTHMKLNKVLEHEAFLYGNACMDKFHFHATVQLFELEYRLDNTGQYECKESELDFTEISLPSVLLKLPPLSSNLDLNE